MNTCPSVRRLQTVSDVLYANDFDRWNLPIDCDIRPSFNLITQLSGGRSLLCDRRQLLSGLMEADRKRRLTVGCLLLIAVNVLWVGSTEATRYMFTADEFDRPFFVTYVKASMFCLHLLVVACLWLRRKSRVGVEVREVPELSYSVPLGDPHLEPTNFGSSESDGCRSLSAEDQQNSAASMPQDNNNVAKHVSFSGLHEVHYMPACEATEARLARLSFDDWFDVAHKYGLIPKSTLKHAFRAALIVFPLWFVANLSYSEALDQTESTVVNILSSTSSLFTLILASFLPSSEADQFNVSKLLLVLLCVVGVYIVSWIDHTSLLVKSPMGIAWSLFGAFGYALYAVLLRRFAGDTMNNMSMFFGFLGLLSFFFLWPLLPLLNYCGLEKMYPMPDCKQWLIVLLNGFFGTVVAEYLWLKACFLTSSFISTMSLTLIIPLTMLVDKVLWKVRFSPYIYFGTVLMMCSFVGATILTTAENWDPVSDLARRFVSCFLGAGGGVAGRRRSRARVNKKKTRRLDVEQSALLIAADQPQQS